MLREAPSGGGDKVGSRVVAIIAFDDNSATPIIGWGKMDITDA